MGLEKLLLNIPETFYWMGFTIKITDIVNELNLSYVTVWKTFKEGKVMPNV